MTATAEQRERWRSKWRAKLHRERDIALECTLEFFQERRAALEAAILGDDPAPETLKLLKRYPHDLEGLLMDKRIRDTKTRANHERQVHGARKSRWAADGTYTPRNRKAIREADLLAITNPKAAAAKGETFGAAYNPDADEFFDPDYDPDARDVT